MLTGGEQTVITKTNPRNNQWLLCHQQVMSNQYGQSFWHLIMTGIGIGISAAAAIVVARQYGRKFPDVDVVVIAPDGIEKYLSMIQFESVDWIHS